MNALLILWVVIFKTSTCFKLSNNFLELDNHPCRAEALKVKFYMKGDVPVYTTFSEKGLKIVKTVFMQFFFLSWIQVDMKGDIPVHTRFSKWS